MESKKWMLLIMLIFFLSGCGQEKEDNIPPSSTGTQYTAEDLFTSSNEIVSPEENEENGELVEDSGSSEESDIPEYLKPQENIEYVKYDAANRCIWPDDEIDLKSMFCIDPDTGVAYFVNQNKDWYIYRLLDGKAELVVELPAREIYVLNGILYFILEDYDKFEINELTEGAIYAYTLADGSMEEILSPDSLENEIYRMRVYEDGIALYCKLIVKASVNEKDAESSIQVEHYHYYYTFADGILKEDPYKRVFPGWEDYYMVIDTSCVPWNLSFRSRSDHGKEWTDFSGAGSKAVIIENTLYTFGRGRCQTDNLLTEEKKTFDINAIFEEKMPQYMEYLAEAGIDENYKLSIGGITVNKDGIWMIVQFYHLLHLDPETGETECYRIEGSKYINDLYTDGINLYGTYGSLPGLCKYDGKPVRICIEEIVGQDSRSDIPVIAVEYLTE